MLESSTCLSPEFRQLKLEELLLYLLDQDASKFRSLQIVARDAEELSMRKAVESNIGNVVTIEELAFLCHMSSSTFKRRFGRIYNTSPQKWLLSQKLQLAAELLSQPAEKLSDVYLKIGYENHSSFSQAFKQAYGLTPSEFHEQRMVVQPLTFRP